MAIILKQFEGSTVTALDDAILNHHLEGMSGIINGCSVSNPDVTTLAVSAGRGLIYGREFEIQAQNIIVGAQEGSKHGRLIIEIDITNTAEPIKFEVQLDPETLPELVQEDINGDGVVYQMELATFEIEAAITNLQNTDNELTPHVVPLAVTLEAGSWAAAPGGGFTQTVNNTAFKANSTIICVAAPESFVAWNTAGVVVAEQGVYTLTFTALAQPAESITANCLILR